MKFKLKNMILGLSILLIGSFGNASQKGYVGRQKESGKQTLDTIQETITTLNDYLFNENTDFAQVDEELKGKIKTFKKQTGSFKKSKFNNIDQFLSAQADSDSDFFHIYDLAAVQEFFNTLANHLVQRIENNNLNIDQLNFLVENHLSDLWNFVIKNSVARYSELDFYINFINLIQALEDKIVDINIDLQQRVAMLKLYIQLIKDLNIEKTGDMQNIVTNYSLAENNIPVFDKNIYDNFIKKIDARTETINSWIQKEPVSKKYVMGGWFVGKGWLPFKSTAETRIKKFVRELEKYNEYIQKGFEEQFFSELKNNKDDVLPYYLVATGKKLTSGFEVTFQEIFKGIYAAYNNLFNAWQKYLKKAFPNRDQLEQGSAEYTVLRDLQNKYFYNPQADNQSTLYDQVLYFKDKVTMMGYMDLAKLFEDLLRKLKAEEEEID